MKALTLTAAMLLASTAYGQEHRTSCKSGEVVIHITGNSPVIIIERIPDLAMHSFMWPISSNGTVTVECGEPAYIHLTNMEKFLVMMRQNQKYSVYAQSEK